MTSPNRAKAVQAEELQVQTNPKAGLAIRQEETTVENPTSTRERKENTNLEPKAVSNPEKEEKTGVKLVSNPKKKEATNPEPKAALNQKKDLASLGTKKRALAHSKPPALKTALPKASAASPKEIIKTTKTSNQATEEVLHPKASTAVHSGKEKKAASSPAKKIKEKE